MGNYLHLFSTVSEYTEARESEYIEPWVSYTLENEQVDFNKSEYEKLLETPLTFEITSGGNITWSYYDGMGGERKDAHATIFYKKNDGEWTEMPRTLSVVSGDAVQFKGDNDGYGYEYGECYDSFSEATTAGFILKGNIMSLIDSENFATATTFASSYTFNFLFYNCTGLTSAENLVLPATTLVNTCYASMFQGCTSLTQAPALPATTLADGCYSCMFWGCTALTAAPELPATTLANDCYSAMFNGCTSLTQAPELPATTLASLCYENMFRDCTSLTQAPELPAETLANNCYHTMFYGCTSLTKAPELPATTLAIYCYTGMFYGCTNLNYIKCLATNISATNSHQNWVSSVAASGTFVKAAGITESTWGRGNNGIPTNWTVQNA